MLKDMKLSKEEAKEEYGPPTTANLPKYPYGLCLTLCDEVLAKLGIDALPKVGSEVRGQFVATVSSVSAYQDQENESEGNVSLQITGLDIESGSDAAQTLYGKSDS